MMDTTVCNKRLGPDKRPTYDVYHEGHFLATVAVIQEPVGNGVGLEVVSGAVSHKKKDFILAAIVEFNKDPKNAHHS